MAQVRNASGERRFVPLIGRFLDPDEQAEIDDQVFDLFDWSSDCWQVVTPSSTADDPSTH